MTSRETVKEIHIGSTRFHLLIQGQVPWVECNGQFFNHVWLLIQEHSILSDCPYIEQFAEISNFLWKGLQFQYVDHISDYQRFYTEQVELEKKCAGDIFQYRLTDYKIFDVSLMHEPRIEGDQLHYFVYNKTTGVPYRVVCPFPYEGTSTLVHYQVLPLKEEPSLS